MPLPPLLPPPMLPALPPLLLPLLQQIMLLLLLLKPVISERMIFGTQPDSSMIPGRRSAEDPDRCA